jgi:DNA (cytosine-5)-methyltransferase 1
MRNHIALFAGLGGFSVATRRVGINTIFATDLETHCIKTIKKSFPGTPTACIDISALDFRDHFNTNVEVDLLSAGFPCQSFSMAGSNLGFDDPRGKLFFEIPRLIKNLDAPPKVVLLENVPFLKIFDNGSRLNIVIQALRKQGYWVSVAQAPILNSRDVCGTPQRRERLYIVAYHSTFFKKKLF